MKTTIKRDVNIVICDFCKKEITSHNKCGICGRDMCLNKHTAVALEVYFYETQERLIGGGSHVCEDCANIKMDCSLNEFLTGMLNAKNF